MPASRTPARPPGARPTVSAGEIQALQEALALRSAVATSKPAVRKPGGKPGVRRPTGKPVASRTRGPSGPAARRKTAAGRPKRAAARPRWSARLSAIALSTVLLPALAVLVLSGSDGSREGKDVTALALTARTTLLTQAGRYQQLEDQVDQRRRALRRAQAVQRSAAARVRAAQSIVGVRAADLYRSHAADRYQVPTLDGDSSAGGDVLLRAALDASADQALTAAIGHARATSAALATARHSVAAASSAVASAAASATAVLIRTRATVADLSAPVTIQLAALGTIPSTGPQQTRNEQAMRRWQNYLHQLAAADIPPPPAAQLADSTDLPSGLSAARGTDGKPIPGVAWSMVGNHKVTVLPAETVAAVSTALSQLGKPYAAGTAGPSSYDCGGFTSAAWLMAGYAVPPTPQGQWAAGAAVPLADLQVGDLVFSSGGKDVGIYLGYGDVLGASAGTHLVGVRGVDAGSAAVRVTLPAPSAPNAALTGATRTGTCGAVLPASGTVSPAWGGWHNGEIPARALCTLGVAGHKLRCDAAASYKEMSKAYARTFGRPLCITDSYRSYSAQVQAFAEKPDLAAVPGTSNHGWALAVDLCGGINVPGTPQGAWMAANAGRFGFVHPDWAKPGAEKPEPWHWEYGYIS